MYIRLVLGQDATLTVIANGCYRWLRAQLRGYVDMSPKTLYMRFVETGGFVAIAPDCILVGFDKRVHNPALRDAALDNQPVSIPWLGNRPVKFAFACRSSLTSVGRSTNFRPRKSALIKLLQRRTHLLALTQRARRLAGLRCAE
jgi:hypothetical protein